ncbi:hypothetical protein ACH4TX_37535 [Streptomyces sp. NPDC021098]|uniref:hypothetical protein n=1 Tax=unclassified Streptomyces TaxID=2593676 RepID=UPI0037B47353
MGESERREACEPDATAHDGEAQVQHRSGDAREREQGVRRPAFAPAVRDARRVRQGQQQRAEPDGRDDQPQRVPQRVQPEHRQNTGRPEELAVRRTRQRAGQPGTGDERPQRAQRRGTARVAQAQRETREQQQGPVPGVTEHHHIGDARRHRGVEVRVRHRPARPHQGHERTPHRTGLAQQRRWLRSTRCAQRHQCSSHRGQTCGGRRNVVGRTPTGEGRDVPAPHRTREAFFELRLTSQQIGAARTLQRVQIGRPDTEHGTLGRRPQAP